MSITSIKPEQAIQTLTHPFTSAPLPFVDKPTRDPNTVTRRDYATDHLIDVANRFGTGVVRLPATIGAVGFGLGKKGWEVKGPVGFVAAGAGAVLGAGLGAGTGAVGVVVDAAAGGMHLLVGAGNLAQHGVNVSRQQLPDGPLQQAAQFALGFDAIAFIPKFANDGSAFQTGQQLGGECINRLLTAPLQLVAIPAAAVYGLCADSKHPATAVLAGAAGLATGTVIGASFFGGSVLFGLAHGVGAGAYFAAAGVIVGVQGISSGLRATQDYLTGEASKPALPPAASGL